MKLRSLLLATLASTPWVALSQSAPRGEQLYRALPGSTALGSCISCHGDPANNRNSVLRGGSGGPWIARTINAVGVMGYLRQYLTEADLADIAAYLATVAPAGAVELLPATWPSGEEFGEQQVGSESGVRIIFIRNFQSRDIALGGVLSDNPQAFPLSHDCPLTLPPLQQCQAQLRFRPQQLGISTSQFRVLDSGGRLLRSGPLAGTGIAQAAPALRWDTGTPLLLDFDRVALDGSRQLSLQLLNPSTQAVSLTRLRANGPGAARFSVEAPCLTSGRLEAGARCTVDIRFKPTQLERSEAWLEMGATASHAPTVRLTGIGEAAPPPPPPAPAPSPAPAPAPTPGNASGGGGGGSSSPLWLLALALGGLGLRRR
jgi:cytochrome c553